jgi:hypothetical protein
MLPPSGTVVSDAEAQVVITSDLARAREVAIRQFLPEQLATDAVARFPGQWEAALQHAWRMAGIGMRESNLGWEWLDKKGRGGDKHGFDEWQVDDRTHAAEVAEIVALPVLSFARREVALKHGSTIALAAIADFPGNIEAGFCRYNLRKERVQEGIDKFNDPCRFTTPSQSAPAGVFVPGDYGRWVVRWIRMRRYGTPGNGNV